MNRLFVGNLSFDVTDRELRDAFSPIGMVQSAEAVRDRFDGRSRGFGFVEMATEEDARRAVDEMNGAQIRGRAIRVEIATGARGNGRRGGAERRA